MKDTHLNYILCLLHFICCTGDPEANALKPTSFVYLMKHNKFMW